MLFCPICVELYSSYQWEQDNNKFDFSHLQSVVCKDHSIDSDGPMIKCISCKLSTDSPMWNTRNQPLCYPCYSNKSRSCSASYCQTLITSTMPGVYVSPGGEKLYCEDCSAIKTLPKGFSKMWHPMAWEYDALCKCAACMLLAGKHSRWPAQPHMYGETTVACSTCSQKVGLLNGTVISGPVAYCHLCKGALKICPKCNQGRDKNQFKRTSGECGSYNKACNLCLVAKPQLFWYCDVGCMSWYPTGSICSCGGIHSYNYSPQFITFLTGRLQHERGVDHEVTPFIGLELEIEAQGPGASRAKGAKLMRELLEDVGYSVHDGSLLGVKHNQTGGEYGFEFVTHPFTYDWFEENWYRFEKALNALSTAGYRSWEGKRCGMHIHISRKPMSKAHQMKFARFIFGSSNLMVCVGQRGYNDQSLTKFSPFHGEDRSRFMEKINNHSNPGVSGHYTALNSLRESTLEARWFRGTLNPSGVRKNVELIHSLWQFTKAFGHSSANESNYIEWLRKPHHEGVQYRTLLDFIERNYITRR